MCIPLRVNVSGVVEFDILSFFFLVFICYSLILENKNHKFFYGQILVIGNLI